jgi:hypothetical protein
LQGDILSAIKKEALRATPSVLNILPCKLKLKLDEKKSKRVGLA